MQSNKFFLISAIIGLTILVPVLGTSAEGPKKAFPEVGPGLTYVHERIGDQPWSIHVLKIDRSRKDFSFATTLAKGTIFGLQPISKQIESLPAELGEPVAAINGDYFEIKKGPYQGDILGLHISQGEITSDTRKISLWFNSEGQPQISVINSLFQVTWPDESTTPIGLNQNRNENQAILYTPTLGESTRTKGGIELILEAVDAKNWLPLKPGQTYRGKIKSVLKTGNSALSPEIMILSIGPELAKTMPRVQPGDEITLSTATSPDLKNIKTAIGYNTLLLRNGEIQKIANKDRHPRTIFGWNERFFFFVVVDGRQKGLSKGMSFQEEAELMHRLGATEAINLDGGGSSTFWLGGQIMNSPSDGRERAVANGLVLLRKPKPTTTTAPTKNK